MTQTQDPIQAPEGCETLRLPEVTALKLQLAYERTTNAESTALQRKAELQALINAIGAEAAENGQYEIHSLVPNAGVLFRKPASPAAPKKAQVMRKKTARKRPRKKPLTASEVKL